MSVQHGEVQGDNLLVAGSDQTCRLSPVEGVEEEHYLSSLKDVSGPPGSLSRS